MSGKLSGTFTAEYIRQQAERCEEMAASYPDECELYQGLANAWRIELPPAEPEPGPVIDVAFCDVEPEP